MEWLLYQAGRSVANAEGGVSTFFYDVGSRWRWVKELFGGKPDAPSEVGSPQQPGVEDRRPSVLDKAWKLGERAAGSLIGSQKQPTQPAAPTYQDLRGSDGQPTVYGANTGVPSLAPNQMVTPPAQTAGAGEVFAPGGPLSGTPGSSNLGKLLGGNQRQMPTQAQPTEGVVSQQKSGGAPPPNNR